MRIKNFIHFVFLLTISMNVAFSQVQLFEQGYSGIVAKTGGAWHPKVNGSSSSIEYNIEGKTTLGISFSQNLVDTLFDFNRDTLSTLIPSTIKTKATGYGAYVILELLEPDKLFPMSFSMLFAYNNTKGEITEGIITTSNQKQLIYSTGPQIGARFYVGDNGSIVPFLEYTFSYVRQFRKHNFPQLKETTELWHSISVSSAYKHLFGSSFGAFIDPKVNIRIGDTDKPELSAALHLGAFYRFQI